MDEIQYKSLVKSDLGGIEESDYVNPSKNYTIPFKKVGKIRTTKRKREEQYANLRLSTVETSNYTLPKHNKMEVRGIDEDAETHTLDSHTLDRASKKNWSKLRVAVCLVVAIMLIFLLVILLATIVVSIVLESKDMLNSYCTNNSMEIAQLQRNMEEIMRSLREAVDQCCQPRSFTCGQCSCRFN